MLIFGFSKLRLTCVSVFITILSEYHTPSCNPCKQVESWLLYRVDTISKCWTNAVTSHAALVHHEDQWTCSFEASFSLQRVAHTAPSNSKRCLSITVVTVIWREGHEAVEICIKSEWQWHNCSASYTCGYISICHIQCFVNVVSLQVVLYNKYWLM